MGADRDNPYPSANLTLVATPHGDFLAIEGDLVTEHLQKAGGHTRPHVALLRSLVDRSFRVLDVGAHIGSFSVPLGLRLLEGGHLWSFEPDEESFRLLRMNLALNGLAHLATTIPMAVSSNPTTLFSVTPEEANTGANFLVTEQSDESSEDPLPAVSIDILVDKGDIDGADLIKIDVEGMEAEVLRGAKATLQRYQPYLFIEVSQAQLERYDSSPVEIESFLGEMGYTFYTPLGPRNRASDEVTVEELGTLEGRDEVLFDVLAVPESRVLPSAILPRPDSAA